METRATAAISADPQPAPVPRPSSQGQARRPAEAAPAQPDLRLVIEEDSASGSFVYKTVDRRTGEVVNQFPREEVLRLREEADYSAGDVITTEA